MTAVDVGVWLLLQVAPAAIDLPWLIAGMATLIGSLSAAVGVTYRGQVRTLETESKRKDELIDRLTAQIERMADVQDRSVSFVEREHRRR
jgi:hypothetical protein